MTEGAEAVAVAVAATVSVSAPVYVAVIVALAGVIFLAVVISAGSLAAWVAVGWGSRGIEVMGMWVISISWSESWYFCCGM